MPRDPLVSLTAFCNEKHPRLQFLTTLNLKALLRLVHPVIQRTESGAGFRASPFLARGIARQWQERGEIQCLKPITIAIHTDFRFTELPHWKGSGAGTLELPIESILEVCDGIQHLTAIALTPPALNSLSQTDWPVHFIETSAPTTSSPSPTKSAPRQIPSPSAEKETPKRKAAITLQLMSPTNCRMNTGRKKGGRKKD